VATPGARDQVPKYHLALPLLPVRYVFSRYIKRINSYFKVHYFTILYFFSKFMFILTKRSQFLVDLTVGFLIRNSGYPLVVQANEGWSRHWWELTRGTEPTRVLEEHPPRDFWRCRGAAVLPWCGAQLASTAYRASVRSGVKVVAYIHTHITYIRTDSSMKLFVTISPASPTGERRG